MPTNRGNNRRFRDAKHERRKLASQQIHELLDMAARQYNRDPALAQKQSAMAWNLSTKTNARLGELRLLFCHKCKKFILPPSGARYRLSKKRHSMNVTCLKCGGTYRKVF